MGIDEARRGSGTGYPDDEDDVLMRNGSATREAPWKGRYYVLFLNSNLCTCLPKS